MKYPFDLVLPCYNPPPGWAANIVTSLARLRELLPEAEPHLILVNDGSPQGVDDADIDLLTRELPHFRYVHYPDNQGKGYALRQGVQQSTHELCLFTDIDFPYTEESMADVLQALHQQPVDIAAGVRDELYYASVPPARATISRLLRFMSQQLLRLPVNDTQCGLKGFSARGRTAFLQTHTRRYLFDLEFLYLAGRQLPLRVVAVPVRLKPNIIFSKMPPRVLLTEGYTFLKIMLTGSAA